MVKNKQNKVKICHFYPLMMPIFFQWPFLQYCHQSSIKNIYCSTICSISDQLWSTERCFKWCNCNDFFLARWGAHNNEHILAFSIITARQHLILSQKRWKVVPFCQFLIWHNPLIVKKSRHFVLKNVQT